MKIHHLSIEEAFSRAQKCRDLPPLMTRPGRMNTLEKGRHASQTLLEHRCDTRYPLPLPGLDDGGGT